MDVAVKRHDDDFTPEQLASVIQKAFESHFPPAIALNKRGALALPNKEPDVVITVGTFKVAVQGDGTEPLPTSSSSVTQ